MRHTATERFHQLHATGCFVMPNPWNPGTARLFEQLGFDAVATTSSGHAWSIAKPDNAVTLEQALRHFTEMAAAVSIPVNADFEHAFAEDAAAVAVNVDAAARTGIAGLSVEDSTGHPTDPLFEFDHAVDRIRAARSAIDASGTNVLLTARTEGYVVGLPNLLETIDRLVAFGEAGADCLYAPGITDLDAIREIMAAVSPLPVNVLVGHGFATVSELSAMGVRRISTGGALARVAWSSVIGAATSIRETGSFAVLDSFVSGTNLDERFRT